MYSCSCVSYSAQVGVMPWQPVYYGSAKSPYSVLMGHFVVENPHPPPACRLPW